MTSKRIFTYKDAGVDIEAGDELVERIKGSVARTQRPEVIGGLGGFGGLFRVPAGFKEPVLVAGTDGVGTKIKLAIEHDAHDDIGIDLVAMCANDVVVQGAEPLFFLDYYATPRLRVDVAERVVKGIARGCELAGCTLLGGETAEHPGAEGADEYDLAGFCVGIVERERIVDGSSIAAGDAVIGLASSGPHSNGFSLIRRVLESRPDARDAAPGGRPLVEQLLAPTRIYVRPLLQLLREMPVKGIAHITGGGLLENVPRILPAGLGVELAASSWPRQPVFEWLAAAGIEPEEMYRTFNCGVGMIVVTAPDHADAAVRRLESSGERAYRIGAVVRDAAGRVHIR
ncbi:MAG TPA: phosphoribosylformylglycinamidine cyclo-ligase [Gammaproteobacteria bacterium]|nr:phosphoribosylformylglycinamidine cyclo-ligase [Gammaproteobacteria bacterium]